MEINEILIEASDYADNKLKEFINTDIYYYDQESDSYDLLPECRDTWEYYYNDYLSKKLNK